MRYLLSIIFSLSLIIVFNSNAIAFTTAILPDSHIIFVQQTYAEPTDTGEIERKIDLWVANFYPYSEVEGLIVSLSEIGIEKSITFNWNGVDIYNYKESTTLGNTYTGTNWFVVVYSKHSLLIHNLLSHNVYQLTWAADWSFTAAPWKVDYIPPFGRTESFIEDIGWHSPM